MQTLIKDGKPVSSFEANGIKYKVLSHAQAMNAFRYFEYERLYAQFRGQATPEYIAQQLTEANKIIENTVNRVSQGGKNLFHATAIYQDIIDKITNPSPNGKSRLNFYMMVCTFFIVEEGEDLMQWTIEAAQKKIENWQEYNFLDFFGLAATFIERMNAALLQVMAIGYEENQEE